VGLNLRVICRPHLAAGFELAGLGVTRVDDLTAAAAVMRRVLSDPHAGVVLIDEGLYRGLPHDLVARFDRQALPVVAPIPSPAWDERAAAESYILEILRQAIGYRVRPR
jgi:vacuolar-type H+-ATPase subunit F/Vma7